MEYNYIFNKEKCWYKENCDKYNTEECNKMCGRYMYLHYLANASLLSEKQQYPPKLVLPDDDKEAYDRLIEIRADIYNYVKSGRNLVIWSDTAGNGKTSWMTKLMMQYFSKLGFCEKPKGLFINFPKFCLYNKNMISGYTNKNLSYILDNIEDVDLVVWDDVAAVDLTPNDYLNLYSYVNSRIDSGKSNFFTMNYGKDNSLSVLGEKLYSRIMKNSEVIEFKSLDFRDIQMQSILENNRETSKE